MSASRTTTLIILLLGSATFSAGQERDEIALVSTLTSPTRVRVRTMSMSDASRGVLVQAMQSALTVVGVVESTDAADLMVLEAGRNHVKIPLASINSVDVSVGRKRNWLPGLGIGIAVGLAVGFAIPVDPRDCGPTSEKLCSRGEAIGTGTVIFGGVATVVGALTRTDVWQRRFSRSPP